MRFDGHLSTWNADRGFGFIRPAAGGQDIFVHISEWPRGFKPVPGEAVTFEVAQNPQGKKKAVQVRPIEARAAAPRAVPGQPRPSGRSHGLAGGVILLAVVAALAWAGWRNAGGSRQPAAAGAPASVLPAQLSSPAPLPQSTRALSCDGRLYCSQMTSCAEATWFLKNCPGVKMDGDNDGVPCEEQLCR